MSAIRPKAGTMMILAGVPIIVAVAFSLTPHTAPSSEAMATEASGHYVTVSDSTTVAGPGRAGDQSIGTTSLVALAGGSELDQKKKRENDEKSKEPTHKPTDKRTETTKPPTKPPVTKTPTVEPTRTELPVTGGREISLALAGGGLVVIGVLLLLLKRMARDH